MSFRLEIPHAGFNGVCDLSQPAQRTIPFLIAKRNAPHTNRVMRWLYDAFISPDTAVNINIQSGCIQGRRLIDKEVEKCPRYEKLGGLEPKLSC